MTVIVVVGVGDTQVVTVNTGGDDDVDNMPVFVHGVPAQERPATGVIHDLDSCVSKIICPTDIMAS